MEWDKKVDKSFPVKLKKYLDRFVVGQEECKREAALAVFRHIYFGERRPFLVIGPSGCGKSLMFRALEGCPLIPKDYSIMCFDVARLTPEGTKGEDPLDIIKNFAKKCILEDNKSRKGLIYLDEIDKIVMPSTMASGENINASVQFQLMNFIEGEQVVGVDTKRILFACGGAFTMLDELWKQRKKKNPVGFSATKEEDKSLFSEATLRDDLIEVGAQKEFLGRITGIVQNKALTRLQMKALLVHPTRGIISQKRESFRRIGLDFEINEETVDWMVKEAIKENLGARSLNNVFEKILGNVEFDMLERGISTVNINKEMMLERKK